MAEEINQKLDAVLTAQQQDNSAQINHADGTVQYAAENRQLLHDLLAKLQSLSPQNPLYGQVSNKAGRVLSSSGSSSALDEAELLFEQLTQQKISQNDKALAYFNLFQVRWRKAFTTIGMDVKEQLYAKALGSFQQAIELDRKYALHDMSEGKGYYPIKKMLGAGGMGCAFLCENNNFKIRQHQLVVVKCFWEDISDSLEQLFQEPKTMHSIAGAYVPEILDYGYADNVRQTKPYFVTEYFADAVDGEAWLEREGCLDLETGLQVAVQIAEALQQAHAKGICHLDLKPANLLLWRVDGSVVVKVIDFGLARVTASQGVESSSTVFGQAMFGTLDYAPPEQRGHGFRYGKPSAKSDVFAFGMTMYRLWTGKHPHPFRERDLPDVVRNLFTNCVENNHEERPESKYLVKSLKEIFDKLIVTKTLPHSTQLQPSKIDDNSWKNACQKNTIESYQKYLEDNGISKIYIETAQSRLQTLKTEADKQAWNKACKENTIKSYQIYLNGNTLKKYAHYASKQLGEAKKYLEDEEAWKWSCQQNTKTAYQSYLDGNTIKKYADDAKVRIDRILWNQTCKQNTIQAYHNYLNGNTVKRYDNDARVKIDEIFWEQTCKQDTKQGYQAYLDGNTVKKYASIAKNRAGIGGGTAVIMFGIFTTVLMIMFYIII